MVCGCLDTHGNKLHETPMGLRPSGRDEFVLRGRVDLPGIATIGTNPSIKMGLGPRFIFTMSGNLMGRGLHRRNTRGGVADQRLETILVIGISQAVVRD
jgi:hypothetical protein